MKFYLAPRYVLRKLNIIKMLDSIDFKTYLDVGCGAGELACSLARPGRKGLGTDFSKEAITTANEIKAERNIPDKQLLFQLGDGTKKTTGQFDLVVCCEVLEHVEDHKGLLEKLIKKSNAYLLISVPAKQKLFDESDEAVGHYRRYEKDQLIELLESKNLEIVKFVNYGYPITSVVRLLRKAVFKRRLSKKKDEKLEDRSKDSGINPVKLPAFVSKLDTQKIMYPFWQFTRLFNNMNLGEGYLVLCKKR